MAEPEDNVHAELRLLYQNATDNIQFCKKQQWWITAQTLAVYAGLLFMDGVLGGDSDRLIDIVIVIVGLGLSLRSTQLIRATHSSANAERDRLDYIEGQFSPVFKYARRRKEVSPAPHSRQIAEDIMMTQLGIIWIGGVFFAIICFNYP
jgi:hypothetical protein